MVDDVYLDDHERAERVKKWWKENAPSIIGGAVLGLGAIFGWRAWQAHQAEQAMTAAARYGQFTDQAQALTPEQVAQRVEDLKNKFGNTPYPALAALEAARLQYRGGDVEAARASYRYVIAEARPKRLRDVARLRLARLQMDQGELDAALETLARADTSEFGPAVDELRGDALVRQGRIAEARTAYEAALEAGGPALSPFLDLKIASLGSGILAPASKNEEGS